ncbi:MAG: hypothetical protein HDR38_09100 [Treponema sp.]|nr:hypothetical protein [Treponema sp.]
MKRTRTFRHGMLAGMAARAIMGGGYFLACSSGDDGDGDTPNTPPVTSTQTPSIDIPAINVGEGTYFPKNGETAAYADTILAIQFDDVPTIGTGTVRIYDGDTVVDTINPKGETYYSVNKNYQLFNVDDQLITISGKTVIIKPHVTEAGYAILSAGKTYSVVVEDGLLQGKVSGADFSGIAKDGWTFTVGAAKTISDHTITVGRSGDFFTIQGALNYIKKNNGTGDWTIKVAAGSYHELLAYVGDANVTIEGDESDFGRDTVVYWRNAQKLGEESGKAGNTQRSRQTFMWQGGNLVIKNMSFVNTTTRKGTEDVQAETLYFDCAKDLVVYNSSFSSYQDTLLLGNNGGRAWFYKCYIDGDVDFIWGYIDVALFEECDIVCRADGKKNQAHIFASRTPVTGNKIGKGFVLLNNDITIEEGCVANYGRNSGSDTQATVLNNRFSGKGTLNTKLWGTAAGTNETDVKGDAAVGYKDYNNTMNGVPVDTSGRLNDTWDLSERIAKREYNGRHVIFNRNYNIETGAYETKANIWDISAFETAFKATADESKKNVFIEPVFVPYLVGDDNELKSTTFTASSFTDGDTFTFSITGGSDFATVDNGTVSAKPNVEGDVTITVTSANGASDTATTHVYKTAVKASKVSLDSVSDKAMVVGDVQWITAQLLAADGTENVTDRRVKWTATDGIVFYNDAKGEAHSEWSGDATDKAETIGIYAEKTGTVTITAKSIAYPDATAATITITVTDDGKTVGKIPAEGFTFSFIGPDKESNDSLLNGTKGTGPARDYNVGSTTTEAFSTTLGTGGKYITLLKEHKEPQLTNTYFKVKGNSHNTIGNNNTWTYGSNAKQDEHNMPTKDALLLKGVQGPFSVTVHESRRCGSSRYIGIRFSDGTIATYDSYANFDENKGSYTVKYAKDDVTDIAISSSNDVYLDYIKLEQYTPPVADISIAFATEKADLDLNGTKTYKQAATVTGADANKATVTYKSSDDKIATVAQDGTVTAVGMGEATITATESVKEQNATYTVHVKDSATPATYKIDFTKINGTAGDYGIFSSIKTNYNGTQHGWGVASGGSITIHVTGNSTIIFGCCQYGDHTNNGWTTDGSQMTLATGENAELTYTYTGAAADITFTNAGANEAYLHSIQVVANNGDAVYAEGKYDFSSIGYETLAGYILALNGLQIFSCESHSYGIVIKNNEYLLLKVSGNCTVTFTGSTYSNGNMTASVETESAGTITPTSQSVKVTEDKTGTYSFTYTGGEATLKFLCGTSDQAYTPSVTVTYN